ncbi:MAG TPA: GNAT family N-acetyltransferase [Limnochordia bacterium]|nr:GNAT family N-acetyltransferase [Limnochordia bacterium]
MRICFVCTGNASRSPMAEVIARQQLEELGLAWPVCSAGTEGVDGAAICEMAVAVCAEAGLSLAGKTRQALKEELITSDTVFVTMEDEHRDVLIKKFGIANDRFFDFKGDVANPRFGDLDAYRTCRNQLVDEVGGLLRLLQNMERKKMRVYFVRHAEADLTIREDETRPLTMRGREDSLKVTAALENKGISKVYSSPYVRAIDTVGNLAETLGLDIVKVDDLREREVGGWVHDFHGYARWQWEDFNHKNPGGESLAEVQKRNIKILKSIIEENLGSSVVIATHGTALSTIINHYRADFDYEGFLTIIDKMPYILCLTLDSKELITMDEIYFGGSTLTYRHSITAEEVNAIRVATGYGQIHPEQLRAGFAGSTLIIAAYENEQAVGFVRLVWDGGAVALIPDILVRPEFQGRGIETKMVRLLLGFLRSKLKPGWGIQVDIRAWANRSLYESLGFQRSMPERRGLPMHICLTNHIRQIDSGFRE